MKVLISLLLVSCGCATVKPTVEVDHDIIKPGDMRVCRVIDEKDPNKLECISVANFMQQIMEINSGDL